MTGCDQLKSLHSKYRRLCICFFNQLSIPYYFRFCIYQLYTKKAKRDARRHPFLPSQLLVLVVLLVAVGAAVRAVLAVLTVLVVLVLLILLVAVLILIVLVIIVF